MNNNKDKLHNLSHNLTNYIKHFINYSSVINEDDLKTYFIFWLYLKFVTSDLGSDDIEVNSLKNTLMHRINIHNNRHKNKRITLNNLSNDGYWGVKFYLDCGLYNIEQLDIDEYLILSAKWYANFIQHKENFKNCMEINHNNLMLPNDQYSI
jgi:hypothetical protein